MTINALLGAAGQMSNRERESFAHRVCAEDEQIQAAFKTKRDSYVFTDRRFIMEDVQGMTGRKRSVLSIPYSKISAYEIESAGHLDTDGELRLWVSGYPEVIKREFRKNVDVYLLNKILADNVK